VVVRRGRNRSFSLFLWVGAGVHTAYAGLGWSHVALAKGHQKGSHGRTWSARRGEKQPSEAGSLCKLNTRASERREIERERLSCL
jgi:hypothetical protein